LQLNPFLNNEGTKAKKKKQAGGRKEENT